MSASKEIDKLIRLATEARASGDHMGAIDKLEKAKKLMIAEREARFASVLADLRKGDSQ